MTRIIISSVINSIYDNVELRQVLNQKALTKGGLTLMNYFNKKRSFDTMTDRELVVFYNRLTKVCGQ